MKHFWMTTRGAVRCLLLALCISHAPAEAAVSNAMDLKLAPGTLHSDVATLIWKRPENAGKNTRFRVLRNGKRLAETPAMHYTFRETAPAGSGHFEVAALSDAGVETSKSNAVDIAFPAAETVVSIVDHGAVGDGKTLNTKAIQAAIKACPRGGVVLVPEGDFLSGAIFLKSGMTLEIAKNGVLRGSTNIEDYLPLLPNRFEGWELETFASLVNAGKLDHSGPPNIHNISIRGEGKIDGGGRPLADAMIAARGMRSRGRLICLMNAKDVEVQGLTLEDPPCWTLHYIYSENVSCHDLTIRSGVRNGDGIDPDSSKNSYIFHCNFSTKDDCIAIKSGKNPEGNLIARPTENVRVFDCGFDQGHGISIGSEMSGGVRGVLVEDCTAGDLLHGFQIKATKDRGGFVEDVIVRNCNLRMITVYSGVNYNNDGEPAPSQPYFRRFHFSGIDMTGGNPGKPLIDINGFPAEGHRASGISFDRIKLPAGAVIKVDQAEDVSFIRILTAGGKDPDYRISRSERVSH